MRSALADRVIVSSDENPMYLDFWPYVAYAYRTLFPGIIVTLAFSTEKRKEDPFVKQLAEHGTVVCLQPLPGVPVAVQTKVERYEIATKCKEEVCYIDDIDEIPIDRDWHLTKTNARKPNTMLLVGSEVFNNGQHSEDGQVPASMMTGEASLFRTLFGDFDILYSCTDPKFSDEEYIVMLRRLNPIPVTHVRRDYRPGIDTIDRAVWPYDKAKLEAGGYFAAHTNRPYHAFKEENDAILRYIQKRYDGGPLPEPLVWP